MPLLLGKLRPPALRQRLCLLRRSFPALGSRRCNLTSTGATSASAFACTSMRMAVSTAHSRTRREFQKALGAVVQRSAFLTPRLARDRPHCLCPPECPPSPKALSLAGDHPGRPRRQVCTLSQRAGMSGQVWCPVPRLTVRPVGTLRKQCSLLLGAGWVTAGTPSK